MSIGPGHRPCPGCRAPSPSGIRAPLASSSRASSAVWGPWGAPPPRVRSRLLQDLLTPSPQTHVGLCDAPPRTKIQAGTLCCPRAPGTWPSWNLRPGEKVAQLMLEGSPSPGHARQKEASLKLGWAQGLCGPGAPQRDGGPVAQDGRLLLHSDLVLRL